MRFVIEMAFCIKICAFHSFYSILLFNMNIICDTEIIGNIFHSYDTKCQMNEIYDLNVIWTGNIKI